MLIVTYFNSSNSLRLLSLSTHNRISSNLKLSSSASDSFVPLELAMAENKKEPKVGWERLQAALEEADKDPKKKRGPPIYEPESYPYHLLSALAYVIPIVDASDLGKYMFEVRQLLLFTLHIQYVLG